MDTISKLPFVAARRSLWAPERSGDWTADCATGRAYADALAEHMPDNPPLLVAIVRQIAESGSWGAVEVGFFTRLGCRIADAGRG